MNTWLSQGSMLEYGYLLALLGQPAPSAGTCQQKRHWARQSTLGLCTSAAFRDGEETEVKGNQMPICSQMDLLARKVMNQADVKANRITEYDFQDEGEYVRVTVPSAGMRSTGGHAVPAFKDIAVTFFDKDFLLTATCDAGDVWQLRLRLQAEICPEACERTLSEDKREITVLLSKRERDYQWNRLAAPAAALTANLSNVIPHFL
eukprot:TRINITY_DN59089_c0_g1_i1.p1 TRINITY_DN59089_c0_g1~~TRINITY_DN59089_c0_g1_i1.p1  ORF type:complete len:205 (-),score=27.80 TRINITY_DN59089_c0_g1_i1:193-807(-)